MTIKSNWLTKLNPRHSLVSQISYATAAITILLSIVLGFYAADISRQQIEREQGESFMRRAKSIVDVLDRGMFERYREIQIVASLEDISAPSVSIERKRNVL